MGSVPENLDIINKMPVQGYNLTIDDRPRGEAVVRHFTPDGAVPGSHVGSDQ